MFLAREVNYKVSEKLVVSNFILLFDIQNQ